MNRIYKKSQHRAKRAFTLIEIMVATVIMVILVGLVIQITGEVLKVWSRASGKLSANAEARIALDLITQDLETAVFRNNGQQWLRVDGPQTVAPDAPYVSQTVALKMFTPALDREKFDTSGDPIPGDICAVAYRLEFKQSYTNGAKVYALYRSIERADNTFNNLMSAQSEGDKGAQYLIKSASGFWSTPSIVTEDNYLVSNVVDFKILIYDEDPGTKSPRVVNADPATLILNGDYAYGGGGGDNVPLLHAEVLLTIVSDEGLMILQHLADKHKRAGTGYTDADDVVREHGQVFSRQVNFLSRPL